MKPKRKKNQIQNQNQKVRKVHCALCLHCKVFKISNDGGRTSVRRVRCLENQWRAASGRILTYDYRTLSRRVMKACEHYLAEEETASAEYALLESILQAAGKEQKSIERTGARI